MAETPKLQYVCPEDELELFDREYCGSAKKICGRGSSRPNAVCVGKLMQYSSASLLVADG